MTNKHRWYDVIVAWASGEDIQYKLPGAYDWRTYNKHVYVSTSNESSQPDFSDNDYQWRVKPKTQIKRYRMALVNSHECSWKVIAVETTYTTIDDPVEYCVQGFIRWVGDIVEVEVELDCN